MTRLLGIDLGSVRIGIAVADTETGRIRPVSTIRRTTPARDRTVIARLVAENDVDEIVVGLPLSLDGGVGPQAAVTREWADHVLADIGLPVGWRDERLTTERALTIVGGAGRGSSGGPPSTPARRAHRARLDREAAALILQAELDARAGIEAR